MNRRSAALVTAGGLAIFLLAWWFALYAPRKHALASARTSLEEARKEEQGLNVRLAGRQDLRRIGPTLDLRLTQLAGWVPDQPNVHRFINDASAAAKRSGMSVVSIAPSVPKPGSAGQGEIALTIEVKGGFFQLLDYLVRIEKLPRTVVIDQISIRPEVKEGQPLSLSVSMQGRMFTASVPQFLSVPPGVDVPPAPGSTGTAGAGAAKAPGPTSTAAPGR